jgi:hypothetical protein
MALDLYITVAPIPGEAMRFWASSQRNPAHTYIVDLSENHGSGACQCSDFIARRQPAINDGKELFTDMVSCKHVRAVREYWMKTTLRNIADMVQSQHG